MQLLNIGQAEKIQNLVLRSVNDNYHMTAINTAVSLGLDRRGGKQVQSPSIC